MGLWLDNALPKTDPELEEPDPEGRETASTHDQWMLVSAYSAPIPVRLFKLQALHGHVNGAAFPIWAAL